MRRERWLSLIVNYENFTFPHFKWCPDQASCQRCCPEIPNGRPVYPSLLFITYSLFCVIFSGGVAVAPTISVFNRTVLVSSGDSAILKCSATGIPPPNITWMRNGIQVSKIISLTHWTHFLILLFTVKYVDSEPSQINYYSEGLSFRSVSTSSLASDEATV